MDYHDAIRSQYLASLEMLKQAVAKCPESMWNDPGDKMQFWRIAYHALFYTHLYLAGTEKNFRPWSGHRKDYQYLGAISGPPDRLPEIGEPFNQPDILAYLAEVQAHVDEMTPGLDLEAESGFSWLPFGKLELQLYNIRHLQQHTGELMERLGSRAGIDIDWVGMKD